MADTQLDAFQQLRAFLQQASADFDPADEHLLFSDDHLPAFQEQFPGLRYRHVGNQQQVQINVDDLPYRAFWSDATCRERIREEDFELDIAVFNLQDGPARFRDAGSQEVYLDGKRSRNDLFLSNARAYRQLLAFLEAKSHHKKGDYEFVDYFSRGLRRIVFISSEGKGRVIINYSDEVPAFGANYDLEAVLRELKAAFEDNNKKLPVFVKSEIISHLKKQEEKSMPRVFFQDLGIILRNAHLNFNVHLYELSIEKIKREYQEYKDKYFDQINSILGKLTNQVLALPLTLLGAAYAIEKSNVTLSVQVLIILAILLTSVFLFYFIKMYWSELAFIEKTFHKDYKDLLQVEIFQKYRDELADFEEVREHLQQKINFTKQFIQGYYWVVNGFNLVLIVFILRNIQIQFQVGQVLFKMTLPWGLIAIALAVGVASLAWVYSSELRENPRSRAHEKQESTISP